MLGIFSRKMSKSAMKREMDKLNNEFLQDLKSQGIEVGIPVQSGQRFRKVIRRKK